MKQTILILFIIFSTSIAKSQVMKAALIGGLNLSQIDGDENFGFHKYGINAGASAIIPLKNRFSIALEILYSQKGSYQSPIFLYQDSTGKYKLKLNYAEVPVLFQYNDKGGFTFGAGFSYGKLVSVREEQYDPKLKAIVWDNVTINDGTYKSNDFEVLADLKVRIYEGFYLNARYSYSMVEIRKRYFSAPYNVTRYQYNNLLSFRIIWVINDRRIDEQVKKQKQEIQEQF